MTQIKKQLAELQHSVLRWWDENKHDTRGEYDDINVYEETPSFVLMAMKQREIKDKL